MSSKPLSRISDKQAINKDFKFRRGNQTFLFGPKQPKFLPSLSIRVKVAGIAPVAIGSDAEGREAELEHEEKHAEGPHVCLPVVFLLVGQSAHFRGHKDGRALAGDQRLCGLVRTFESRYLQVEAGVDQHMCGLQVQVSDTAGVHIAQAE